MPARKTKKTAAKKRPARAGGSDSYVYVLGTIGKDALVQVRTARGLMNYRTTKVFVYSKEELAKNAVSLFRQDRPRNRLVLITCTDWDGSDYDSNVIVFAEPLGVRNPPRRQTGNDRLA